jgi:2-methylcitrate dehydratase PrpD
VTAQADPSMNLLQTAVEVEMADGAVHKLKSDHPKGSFENPLSRKEVEDKFRVYAKAQLSVSAIEEIIAAVNALEQLPSVSSLVDMLSPAKRRDAA